MIVIVSSLPDILTRAAFKHIIIPPSSAVYPGTRVNPGQATRRFSRRRMTCNTAVQTGRKARARTESYIYNRSCPPILKNVQTSRHSLPSLFHRSPFKSRSMDNRNDEQTNGKRILRGEKGLPPVLSNAPRKRKVAISTRKFDPSDFQPRASSHRAREIFHRATRCVYIPIVNFHRSLFLSTIFLAARRIVGKNNSVTRLENTDWIGSFAVFTTRAHWPILFLKFPRPNSPIPRDPLSPLWIDVVARSRMRQHCTPYTIIFPGARDSAVSPTIHKHRSNYDPFAK